MKYTEAFLSGLAGAIIAAGATYWSIVDSARNDAILKSAVVDAKEKYLTDIRESISLIAKAEESAENSVRNAQKQIARFANYEEQASKMLGKLNLATKEMEQQLTLDDEQLAILKEKIVLDIASIQIPVGAVIPFSKNACPSGWKEYSKAYGRFIRGIDKTGRIDPDGVRLAGHIQDDTFKNHDHALPREVWAFKGTGSNQPPSNSTGGAGVTRTDGSGGLETRPKNVALLYCQKI